MKYVHIALIVLQAALGAAAADGVLSTAISDTATLGKVVAAIAAVQLVVKTIDGYLTSTTTAKSA